MNKNVTRLATFYHQRSFNWNWFSVSSTLTFTVPSRRIFGRTVEASDKSHLSKRWGGAVLTIDGRNVRVDTANCTACTQLLLAVKKATYCEGTMCTARPYCELPLWRKATGCILCNSGREHSNWSLDNGQLIAAVLPHRCKQRAVAVQLYPVLTSSLDGGGS
jgi:hypothetical protein